MGQVRLAGRCGPLTINSPVAWGRRDARDALAQLAPDLLISDRKHAGRARDDDEHSHADNSSIALPFSANIIGGASVGAADGRVVDVLCPSDARPFMQIARSGPEDVDRAVKAARKAFEGEWGKLTATERGRLLVKLGQAIAENAAELAALKSRDTGKPLKQGKADMVAAARYFELRHGRRQAAWRDHPLPQRLYGGDRPRPHGVTGHIIPWNYPAQIFGRSIAASLACGNACVVKPAEDACLSVIRFAELARDIGFPDGALNSVAGLGGEAGAALSAHPGLDFISFTGSPQTGAAIQAAAAMNNIGVTMELGGNSPQVVFADADIEAAAPVVINAIIQNGGQTCSAGSRVLIERKAYDPFAGAIADRFAKVRAGAHEKDLDMGAMINAKQQARVNGFLARAKKGGNQDRGGRRGRSRGAEERLLRYADAVGTCRAATRSPMTKSSARFSRCCPSMTKPTPSASPMARLMA